MRSAAGSSVSPVCTGPGLHDRAARRGEPAEPPAPVLLGRAGAGVPRPPRRVGPPRTPPRRRASGRDRRRRRRRGSSARSRSGSRCTARAEVVQRPAVEQHPGVDRLPALDPRHDPQHGVLVGVPHAPSQPVARARPAGSPPRVTGAVGARRDRRAHPRQPRVPGARGPAARVGCADRVRVRSPGSSASHSSGTARRGPRQQRVGDQRRERGVGGVDVRARTRAARGRPRRRARATAAAAPRPVVVERQRGAVVDQVQPAVPEQHVRVAPRAVDVADQRVEPQHPPGERRVQRRTPAGRSRARRAGSPARGCAPG